MHVLMNECAAGDGRVPADEHIPAARDRPGAARADDGAHDAAGPEARDRRDDHNEREPARRARRDVRRAHTEELAPRMSTYHSYTTTLCMRTLSAFSIYIYDFCLTMDHYSSPYILCMH